jgi:hypothetical protein
MIYGCGDLVLEVDKVAAEGVLIVGDGANIGPAQGMSNHFGGATVVRERDGGYVLREGVWHKGCCGKLEGGLDGSSGPRRGWGRCWRQVVVAEAAKCP